MRKRGSREEGNQARGELGKWGNMEVGKQGRHVHPFPMRCPGVSKDDGCLSEGNHKSFLLLRHGHLPEQKTKKNVQFGNVQRGTQAFK